MNLKLFNRLEYYFIKTKKSQEMNTASYLILIYKIITEEFIDLQSEKNNNNFY
jgi:hypothetical protein